MERLLAIPRDWSKYRFEFTGIDMAAHGKRKNRRISEEVALPKRNILSDSPPEFFDEPRPEEGRDAALARIAAERVESERQRPTRRR